MKRLVFVALSGVLAAASACSGIGGKNGSPNGDGFPLGDDTSDPPLPPPRDPDINNDDSGAFGVGSRGKDAGTSTEPDASSRGGADAAPAADADTPDASTGVDSGAPDSGNVVPDSGGAPDTGTVGPPDACPGGGVLSAGDLAVVEIMIQSQSGSGDHGEWLEVQSTRTCSLNLNGLHFESPRGTGKDTLDITTDTWLPANGIFVVADSSDATKNHDLPPGPLYTWNGQPGDVLVNGGDTVTLTAGGVTVETFTYPQFQTLYVGRSISFPADCAWSDRSSWARWSFSFNTWSGSFLGTPNADNTDVTCY